MSKRKVIGGTAILAVIVFAAIFGIMSLVDNAGKTTNQITAEQTVEELNRYVDKKVDVKKVTKCRFVSKTLIFQNHCI